MVIRGIDGLKATGRKSAPDSKFSKRWRWRWRWRRRWRRRCQIEIIDRISEVLRWSLRNPTERQRASDPEELLGAINFPGSHQTPGSNHAPEEKHGQKKQQQKRDREKRMEGRKNEGNNNNRKKKKKGNFSRRGKVEERSEELRSRWSLLPDRWCLTCAVPVRAALRLLLICNHR